MDNEERMIQFLVAAVFRIESLHITMASHTSRSLLRRLAEQLQSMPSDRRKELSRLVTSQLCQGGYFAILMKDSLSTVQSVLLDLMDLCEQAGTLDDKYKYLFFLMTEISKISGMVLFGISIRIVSYLL